MTALHHRSASPGRLRRAVRERHPLLGALAGVLALHMLGFGLLLLVVVPSDLRLSTGEAFGIGLGLTAYTLGMRHAFDADHIAAIDNTTRKLLQDGTRPHAAGFFFSAGHSTVVLVLALVVAAGVQGVGGVVTDEGSTLRTVTGIWGPLVAGVFLLAVGTINMVSLVRWLRALRGASGDDAAALRSGAATSPFSGLVRRVSGRVTRSWQLYPIGFLFGLGFDTATEIALLVLAGGGAASGLPVLSILCLPILFAAGMTLLDTLNGAAMTKAYGWALHAPRKRIAYNATVTGVSALFALVIGSFSLLGVLVDRAHIESGPLAALAGVDLGLLGFGLLAIVLVAWAIAALWWRMAPAAAAISD